jgi:hypothetical protein
MLDKLNQIANMVAEAIAAHPDNKKKDEEADIEPDADDAQDGDDKAAKTQKSVRKAMGGQKEPQY